MASGSRGAGRLGLASSLHPRARATASSSRAHLLSLCRDCTAPAATLLEPRLRPLPRLLGGVMGTWVSARRCPKNPRLPPLPGLPPCCSGRPSGPSAPLAGPELELCLHGTLVRAPASPLDASSITPGLPAFPSRDRQVQHSSPSGPLGPRHGLPPRPAVAPGSF